MAAVLGRPDSAATDKGHLRGRLAFAGGNPCRSPGCAYVGPNAASRREHERRWHEKRLEGAEGVDRDTR